MDYVNLYNNVPSWICKFIEFDMDIHWYDVYGWDPSRLGFAFWLDHPPLNGPTMFLFYRKELI